jgi:hypothetical protein
MTSWNGPDLAETPFDLRLLDWLRDHPDRSAHQIAVSLDLCGPHDRQAVHVVETALKRLKLRSLVRAEDRISPTSRLTTRYWSAAITTTTTGRAT